MIDRHKIIVDAIARRGGWVDADVIVDDVKICRKQIIADITTMDKKYDWFTKRSKRLPTKIKFGSLKALYRVEAKVDLEMKSSVE